ncbi:MAG: 2OG-Fe(II) oxygenase [Caulobacteraceae bacterium]
MSDAKASAQEAVAEANRILSSGAPDALKEGMRRLDHAAQLGSGEAIARLAYFLAAGVFEKPDWDRSVSLLREAAELGWDPARQELSVLARSAGDTPKASQDRVNIREWIAPRPSSVVSDAPRIRTIRAFMSAEECGWVIQANRRRLQPAAVHDKARGDIRVDAARSNSDATVGPMEIDVVMVFLQQRIANTLGLPSTFLEPPSVLHYSPGQQFEPHCDFFEDQSPGMATELQQRGQRIATFLVYLNEDYEGGETDFPRIGYRFKGRTGDALAFANVDPVNRPDLRTLHAGLPPVTGEKWLLSQWVRNRAPM